jgi:myb proto-oncogene protein
MVRKPIHADAGANGTEANKERKGLWSPEEDERLFTQITYHGVSTWSSVAQLAGKIQFLQTDWGIRFYFRYWTLQYS